MKLNADLAGVLRDHRERNFPLQGALLEMLDNSIDEGASEILIRETDGDLVITDNGGGFENIESALTVGKSTKTGKVGRYGVGLKHCCVRYSDDTVIESRGVRVSVPWVDIIQGNSNGDLFPETIEDDGCTRIKLLNFRGRYSQAIQTQEIRRVYLPLIAGDGLCIEVNGERLAPLSLPSFTESLDETFDFQGRKVTISGGIYKPDDPMRQIWKGYNPFYAGRMIGPGKITAYGTGDEGCTNFSFMLTLEDDAESWVLATNKDSVEDLPDLLEYCYHRYTREMLERGAESARDIELRDVEESINRALSSGNITRRRSDNPKPSVKPTDSGPKKSRSNTSNGRGRYMVAGGRSSLLFRFSHLGGDGLGEIQRQGKQIIVTANLDNPFIDQNKTNEAMILCLAKFSYAMQSNLSKDDLVSEEQVTGIMNQAGEELSFCPEIDQS